MNKIAAFCAGDTGVVMPCIVLFSSINAHNPNIFDFYLILDDKDENGIIGALCKQFNIEVILVSDVDCKNTCMGDLYKRKQNPTYAQFPCALFYNYYAPLYFYEKHYQYSIRYDFDMLCTNSYDIEHILPDEDQMASVLSFNYKEYLRDYSIKCKKYLVDAGYLGEYPENTCNAGFIVYNNKLYFEQNSFEIFAKIYSALYDDVRGMKAIIDQDALGILFSQRSNIIKKLTLDYNYRVYEKRMFQDITIKNIHFNGHLKPWLQMPIFTNGYVNSVYFYARIWLQFASGIPEVSYWLTQRGMDISHLDDISMAKIMEQEEKIVRDRIKHAKC